MKPINLRLVIVGGFFVLFLGLGLASTLGSSGPDSPQSSPVDAPLKSSTSDNTTGYTLEQVAEHGVKNDCWLAIRGKVYNVTEFLTHPGGEAILEGCGTDATFLFENRPSGSGTPHSSVAEGVLDNFYIGVLIE